MAPSAGHVHSYVVRNVRVLKAAWRNARQALQARIVQPSLRPQVQTVRSGHPIHPAAYLKQLKSRLYSTGVRNFSTSIGDGVPKGVKYIKSSFPQSRTATTVNASTGRAPFASTLRPNLTGGTLGRTAGGYTLGSGRVGGARFFSHGPAAPAEVVQNVSQAVRAFFLSGQKAQYNGVDRLTGEKRFRAVTLHQDAAIRKAEFLPKATPGSYVDFRVNPSITALTPLDSVAGHALAAVAGAPDGQHTLNSEGLIDVLAVDFSRALKDLAIILNDLKLLASLGDLPITYRSPESTLRVHFPGCDAISVETICNELGVRRGIVNQDEDFDSYVGTEIALLFPHAPSQSPTEIYENEENDPYLFTTSRGQPVHNAVAWADMLSSPTSNKFSTQSHQSYDDSDEHWDYHFTETDENPWASDGKSPSGYESVSSRGAYDMAAEDSEVPLEYQNLRSILQFIQLCDANRR